MLTDAQERRRNWGSTDSVKAAIAGFRIVINLIRSYYRQKRNRSPFSHVEQEWLLLRWNLRIILVYCGLKQFFS